MILRFFALRDSKMNLYMTPMGFQSRGQAIRAITDEVNRVIQGAEPPTTLQAHPEDIALYEIGEFDTETGVMVGLVEPNLVMACSDLRSK